MSWHDANLGRPRPGRYVTHQELHEAFHHLNERIEELKMADQAAVDAITAQVQQVQTDLTGAKNTLQAEIDQLATQNPQIDLTTLQQAVAPLDAAVNALGALQPTSTAQPAPVTDQPPAGDQPAPSNPQA